MTAMQVPKIIDQPTMPQNYYGSSIAINNVSVGDFLFLGNNQNAEKLKIQKIEPHEEMWYLNVIDSNNREFTIRYGANSRVQLAPSGFYSQNNKES